MQMKVEHAPKIRFDRNRVRKFIEEEDDFVTALFDCFEVPDTVEGRFPLKIIRIFFNLYTIS